MLYFDKKLDARGLVCPMPVLKTNKILRHMESGQILKVIASDPIVEKDIPEFCKKTGNQLLEAILEDDHYVFYIQKGEG